jgi:hypothetical protein
MLLVGLGLPVPDRGLSPQKMDSAWRRSADLNSGEGLASDALEHEAHTKIARTAFATLAIGLLWRRRVQRQQGII